VHRSREATRLALVFSERGRCHICGLGELNADPWEIEHVVPSAKGGREGENLRLAHRSCNRKKGTRHVASYDEREVGQA
jgi:5-methylcytosine-specific restriction endonuclease McrA